MKRELVFTDQAPAPIGPYSQAIRCGELLFVSGQVPLDPATGELVNDTFEVEVRQVLANLTAVLQAGGARLSDVVKTTIYVTDMSLFAELNAIYGEYFDAGKPARATVQVGALPKGARVEIDAIALVASGM